MLKKQQFPTSNNSRDILMILNGAKKRRSMAIASVRQVNAEVGVNLKLVAVK